MSPKKINIKKINESNGSLSIFEFKDSIPFNIKRIFTVNTKINVSRGNHAHKKCHQFMVCIKGKIKLITHDGKDKNIYELVEGDDFGVHVPPTVWAEQKSINKENILLVIASEIYDESDYIRDFNAYLTFLNK